MIDIYGKAIKGRRKFQQDNYDFVSNNMASMAVVCDGMGGLTDGDWASYIAVQLLRKHFDRLNIYDNIPDFFKNEIKHLDDVVCKLVDDKNKKIITGTTFASAIIVENRLYIGSIGDSKVYLYSNRNNTLRCLTREHTYRLVLDEKRINGMIDNSEYMAELEKAESLVSYLGVGHMEYYDVNEEPYVLENKDVVIVCSDGIYKGASENDILMAIREHTEPYGITEYILNLIENKNYKSQDNATIVVMEYVQ